MDKHDHGQIKRLVDLGFHEAAGFHIRMFEHQIPDPKRSGGLLIVSEKLVNFQKQCELLKVDNCIDLSHHRNVVKTPESLLYWIYDVDDGRRMIRVSIEDALAMFEKEKRRPVTTVEMLAIYRQNPEILKTGPAPDIPGHFIDAPGSRVWLNQYIDDAVPTLMLDSINHHPRMVKLSTSKDSKRPSNKWGTASCSSE